MDGYDEQVSDIEGLIEGQLAGSTLSRRALLKRAGVTAAAVGLSPLLGRIDSASAALEAAADSTTATLRKLLHLPRGKAAGAGLTINVGSVLAFSGPGAYYGADMSKAINLAVKQIKAAGGPNFKITYKDHKSGDANAGATAGREIGSAGIHLMLASYSADIGALLPAIAQYKILSLDGGGGAATAFQGKPFFYGSRAVTPDDTYDGTYKYIAAKMPKAKRVALVVWDLGDAVLNPGIARLKAALAKHGMSLVHVERTQIGATDFSATLAAVKAAKPDIVQLGEWGLDPGYFMKQYATSGIKAQVIGSEFTPPAEKIASSAYDKYWFAFDFFDAARPSNPWSQLFVKSFEKAYHYQPDFYAANYYEDTFALWEVVRRVIAAKGSLSSGDDLLKAFLKKPTFPSVYGGSKTTVGTWGVNTKNHSVSNRFMGLFSVKGGEPKMLASFNLGGRDYKAIA
jgi:branched-chain amino acid transport system substrate-binding protein